MSQRVKREGLIMQKTNIPYVDFTWNPGCGCPLPIESPGCEHCWARGLHNMRHEAYKAGKKLPIQYAKPFEEIQLFPDRLDEPTRRKTPCSIAVNFMGDLFAYPFEFIDKVIETTIFTQRHTYQILTKSADRMAEYWREFVEGKRFPHALFADRLRIPDLIRNHSSGHPPYKIPPNLWLGVTVCTPGEKYKIDALRYTPAAVRFISFEPLLGDMGELSLDRIAWVIVGGESGPHARPMHPDWARSIRDQCHAAGMPFFFKQWGEWSSCSPQDAKCRSVRIDGSVGDTIVPYSAPMTKVGKKKAGCLLDGVEHKEFPKGGE